MVGCRRIWVRVFRPNIRCINEREAGDGKFSPVPVPGDTRFGIAFDSGRAGNAGTRNAWLPPTLSIPAFAVHLAPMSARKRSGDWGIVVGFPGKIILTNLKTCKVTSNLI